jgi:hypothetical protein
MSDSTSKSGNISKSICKTDKRRSVLCTNDISNVGRYIPFLIVFYPNEGKRNFNVGNCYFLLNSSDFFSISFFKCFLKVVMLVFKLKFAVVSSLFHRLAPEFFTKFLAILSFDLGGLSLFAPCVEWL